MKELYIDLVLYIPLAFTLWVSFLSVRSLKKKVKQKALSERRAKNYYSLLIFLTGLFSGTILFYILMQLFKLNAGHGEMIIFTFLINIFFSFVLMLIGRIIIGWKTIIY